MYVCMCGHYYIYDTIRYDMIRYVLHVIVNGKEMNTRYTFVRGVVQFRVSSPYGLIT